MGRVPPTLTLVVVTIVSKSPSFGLSIEDCVANHSLPGDVVLADYCFSTDCIMEKSSLARLADSFLTNRICSIGGDFMVYFQVGLTTNVYPKNQPDFIRIHVSQQNSDMLQIDEVALSKSFARRKNGTSLFDLGLFSPLKGLWAIQHVGGDVAVLDSCNKIPFVQVITGTLYIGSQIGGMRGVCSGCVPYGCAKDDGPEGVYRAVGFDNLVSAGGLRISAAFGSDMNPRPEISFESLKEVKGGLSVTDTMHVDTIRRWALAHNPTLKFPSLTSIGALDMTYPTRLPSSSRFKAGKMVASLTFNRNPSYTQYSASDMGYVRQQVTAEIRQSLAHICPYDALQQDDISNQYYFTSSWWCAMAGFSISGQLRFTSHTTHIGYYRTGAVTKIEAFPALKEAGNITLDGSEFDGTYIKESAGAGGFASIQSLERVTGDMQIHGFHSALFPLLRQVHGRLSLKLRKASRTTFPELQCVGSLSFAMPDNQPMYQADVDVRSWLESLPSCTQ